MIKVLFFGRLADLAKVRCANLDCPEEGISLYDFLKQMVVCYPDLRASLAQPHLLFLAINQEQADLDAQVKGGDEVAIMPPFSGG